MLNPDSPILRPLAVRLILVALPFCAAAYGFRSGSMLWGIIAGAVAAFLFHRLFLSRI
ncbi:hypothetical protein [Paracoccus sp. (in: a-proteobacteria)]|uniref:hypothetical protein n=1 Tax=Paracoccus sp. TaxID=267 RepID=UPI0026DFBBA9|nr:hypothetical protein [Paracoccus sp. (in: a-proteobacteria)]MDO5647607.1 hypothetical protein [Paracoccus sp. (in: a-proteobacteria)]